jgi:hypothetical protein
MEYMNRRIVLQVVRSLYSQFKRGVDAPRKRQKEESHAGANAKPL